MPGFDLTKKTSPVVICEYNPEWVEEFASIARSIRLAVGPAAIRIDHIGSTAVQGLAAKDVVDVQVTVADVENAGGLVSALTTAGFRLNGEIAFDEFRTMATTDAQLRKVYMREPEGERRAHIHIREYGRFNQRYALLFRDYLRASSRIRSEYEVLKRRAAQIFPDNLDGYLFLKDPVFHIIYEAACQWALLEGWQPDDDFS